MKDQAAEEPNELYPQFWDSTDYLLRTHLQLLDVPDEDAEAIKADILERCRTIAAVLPSSHTSRVHSDFGALMCDIVSAEQQIHAARYGRLPGRMLVDWPPTPLTFRHPFLIEVQKVLTGLEVELNALGGRQRPN